LQLQRDNRAHDCAKKLGRGYYRTGETNGGALGLDFDRRLKLQFRGSAITSDAGLLAYRELDDVLALTTIGGERLADARTGKNSRHLLVGLLRQ
jgi:hypothetical protein